MAHVLRLRPFYGIVLLLLSLWLGLSGVVVAQSGDFDWSDAAVRELYPGIAHAHIRTDTPRPLNINCVRIDTNSDTPLRFFTTPRVAAWELGEHETMRQSTRDFLRQYRDEGMRMVVAVNADAFSPWPAPWNEATLSTLLGLAVSDGTLVSAPNGTPSLLVYEDGRMEMARTDENTELEGVHTAVSGFGFALRHGEVQPSGDDQHPRTGLGLSEDGDQLYILTIDGRRHASHGVTVQEVGAWLQHFGAYDGINMDGGGSTTLAWWDEDAEDEDPAQLLNEPITEGVWLNRTPEEEAEGYAPTERYNGNNLGVLIGDAAAGE